MSKGFTIGFLGAGRMATALVQGLLRAGLARADEIVASDSEPAAREAFARATGCTVTADNAEAAGARTVIVAVKPHQVPDVLAQVRPALGRNQLVVSIAAGVPIARLEGLVPEGVGVVRVMPNTPAVVGASATAFTPGTRCSAKDCQYVSDLFSSVGIALQVPEPLLDAVTGVSGSGPAYAYLMIEALSDGGVAAGLPRETSTRLAAQTLLGAAKMVLETGLHPGVLKDQVTSPGGTTIEALHELERGGVRGALISAVRAAASKSRQLAQG